MSRTNHRKESFILNLPSTTVDGKFDSLRNNIRFNFEYFDPSQQAGQAFSEWDHKNLVELLEKLKNYCKETIEHWKRERVGGGSNHVLEIYGSFPISSKTDFKHPKFVPTDVAWARFHLENRKRLIGFVLPSDECTLKNICNNTFYVVFLDRDHRFYKT